jgi:hypothetical protein
MLLDRAEASEEPILNMTLNPEEVVASSTLYFALIMMCRGVALDHIVNAGQSEGLRAWALLHKQYDTTGPSHWAALLLRLLTFSMEGSLDERMATFERNIAEYEKASKEILSDKMRIGILTIRLPDGPLKQHVIMHALKLNTWILMKQELLDITRAQAAAQPMDLGAMSKGKGPKGGGKRSDMKCNHCGKTGHKWADCRSRLAEAKKGGGGKGGRGGGAGGGKGKAGDKQ